MKIEFGCGETPTKEGFKTCDIRNVPGVDFVCPAWEIDLHVEENTVDEIFSRHFFEHLTYKQGRIVLQKWHKILKPTGVMHMMLPNLDFHIRQYTSKTKIKEALAGFYGWQRGAFDDTWDTHKSGYNFDLLQPILTEEGYTHIVNVRNPKNRHLEITCVKP